MKTKKQHPIRSMTGFGRWAGQDKDWSQSWEIRSVNGRHMDVRWRLPLYLRSLESQWEKVIRDFVQRGRLEVYLHVRFTSPEMLGMTLNTPQAQRMITQLEAFASDRGDAFTPDYNRFLSMSSLWEDDMGEPAPELVESLTAGLRSALQDLNGAREIEGRAMADDLNTRIARLDGWREELKELAPQAKEDKFKALDTRMQNILEKYSVDPDPERMLQEVAILSDRLDVSEELTRLAAHTSRLQELLQEGGELGKRLDFTLQECFREINTCGNKAQSVDISRLAVDFKAELEKCREQVQNIE